MRVNYRKTVPTDEEAEERRRKMREARLERMSQGGSELGMSAMKKASGRAFGDDMPMTKIASSAEANAGQAVGGTFKPSVEQTSIPQQTAGMADKLGSKAASGANMASMGSTVGSIGAVIGGSDDKQQAETTRLAQDDSMRQANQARLRESQATNVDANELLEKARRYGRGS